MDETLDHVVVIGGGISGLAAAHRLEELARQDSRRLRVTVVEGEERFGGKVLSERRGDFVIEAGPDSFIPQKPQTMELVRELGLEHRLLASNDTRRGLAILHRGRLEPVPPGLQMLVPEAWRAFLRSPLLSWRGKLRMAAERFRPRRRRAEDGSVDDESLASFVRRRLGDEVLERLAEPLLAHIHVGDVERMSLEATYPRLAEMERRHGALARGLRAARRARPKGGEPPPLFWTLRGGMGELIGALVERLEGATLRRGRRVLTLEPGGSFGRRFAVRLDGGETLPADAVVLAVPSFAAAEVVQELFPNLAEPLRRIRYVSLATLSLAFRSSDLAAAATPGFGFFVPRHEKRRLLACTWTSVKFDHRAPEDHTLVRVFLGGALQQRLLTLDDGELVETVLDELRAVTGIGAEPELVRLHRWPRGYPQYEVGHRDRLAALDAERPTGITLAGGAYRGVGLSDCIASGRTAAEECLASLSASRDRPLATPVLG